jgi:pyruvate,water dikinase
MFKFLDFFRNIRPAECNGVDQKSDMVRGEMKKYQEEHLRERLDLLGRLLGSVRLLDMHLSGDHQIGWYVEQFLRGNYRFEAKTA